MQSSEAVNLREHLKRVAARLDAAGHGERRTIVEAEAAFLGISVQTLYARLTKQVAWRSGRKTRADKGSTCQDIEAAKLVAGMQKPAVRKNGKVTLHLPTALSIAQENGAQIRVGTSQMGKLLRDRKLDVNSQKQAKAFSRMRSLHPNHVHQVDPSLCLIYYMPDGSQHIIRDDEFYKNKLENVAKLDMKVWRYVLYDHASGAVIPWYVQAKGETQGNLFDFLMFAWGQQPGRPFHGVPHILVWDKGSANGAHAIKNMLKSLQVEDIPHTKGNARAKGGVENGNNIVETHFECRLRFQPVNSVEELNAAAFAWANAYNANLIPRVDSRIHRNGVAMGARYDLWLRIRQEQLRLLPPVEVCRALMEGKSVTRKVNMGLEISYRHPQAERPEVYDVSGLDGVCVGDMVEVSPLVYGRCAVIVRAERFDGAPLEYILEPVEIDPQWGFRKDAAVWGEEHKAKADTLVETQAKELDRMAYPGRDLKEIQKAKDKNETPFDGKLDTLEHLKKIDMPAYMARRGSEIGVPDRITVEIKPLTVIEAARRLRERGVEMNPERFAQVSEWYPPGVPEGELEQLVTRLSVAEDEAPRLAIVK